MYRDKQQGAGRRETQEITGEEETRQEMKIRDA